MYKFRNDIITHAPTSCLIEDYQTLQKALDALECGCLVDAKELLACTMECLASVIDKDTEVPDDVLVCPSASSLIAMSCQEGILTNEAGGDFRCADGRPVSMAMSGCCQCSAACCKYHNGCEPEEGKILLEGGFLCEPGPSQDEELLKHLASLKT
jgi:hypothetical protein